MLRAEFPDLRAFALHCDSIDVLAEFRNRFYLPSETIYLDGNSLGLLAKDAERAVFRVMQDWRERAIGGWTEAQPAWFTLAEDLGAQMAALVGAGADEVIVTNSTTVNLHQLLSTLYTPDASRPAILADVLNFPSDLYALSSHLRLRGLEPKTHLRLAESRDGLTLSEDDLIAAMTPEVQCALFPAVLYQSGQLLDMQRLTAEAHRRGILIGFDCSHSIGAVSHELDAWGVDFAFWCSYKYLCAGPGSAGGLYLNRRHFGRPPGMAGWFGHRKATQFEMSPDFEAAEGAGSLQIGTPNILSMAPLIGTLPLFAEAGMERLRAKSLAMTDYLMTVAEEKLSRYDVQVVNPREAPRRGGHVALRHPEARRLSLALRAEGVIPDFRPPDIIRLAPAPLYNTFTDCYEAVLRLASILETRAYERQGEAGGIVT